MTSLWNVARLHCPTIPCSILWGLGLVILSRGELRHSWLAQHWLQWDDHCCCHCWSDQQRHWCEPRWWRPCHHTTGQSTVCAGETGPDGTPSALLGILCASINKFNSACTNFIIWLAMLVGLHTVAYAYCYTIASLQNNEIDLDALLLMSEKDFSEIGLPKVWVLKCFSLGWAIFALVVVFILTYCVYIRMQGPRLKLLTALGRKPSSSEDNNVATDNHSEDPLAQGEGGWDTPHIDEGDSAAAASMDSSSSFSPSACQQSDVSQWWWGTLLHCYVPNDCYIYVHYTVAI